MKWRKYEQIIDKICAWFLYQQILTRIHELSLESNPAVKEVMKYMKELCVTSMLPADKSEITITDNNNIKWRILRKDVHAGNQLMFFQTNQPNNIHVSIPSTWNVQKVHEIHIGFDERRRHYRRYKKVFLDNEGEFCYRDGRTVVEQNDLEHATTFTMDQKVECFKIFEAFEAFNNDFHFWRCDEHSTIQSPCRILSKSPPPAQAAQQH